MLRELNILITSNKKYLKYASVLLVSIFESNLDAKIHIFYVYRDQKTGDFYKIKHQVEKNGGQITFLTPDDAVLPNGIRTSQYISLEAYDTLFPQFILPDDLKKILYLDVDTIVTSDLFDLYETELDGNFIAAAAHEPHSCPKAPFDEKKMRDGAYFNSGVILYDLEKMRTLSPETYYEVLNNSEKFFYDQGMLNWLFCEKTKYLETMKYNYRYGVAKRNPGIKTESGEKTIIHYNCTNILFKPWDLLFTDEEICGMKNMPAWGGTDRFFIDKQLNDLNKIWWQYAARSEFYPQLWSEMEAKKEYILRLGIINRYNEGYWKIKRYENRYAWREKREWGVVREKIEYDAECFGKSLSEYFMDLVNQKWKVVIMACKDTGANYWKDFCKKAGLILPDLEKRKGMISILCGTELVYWESKAGYFAVSVKIKREEQNENGIFIQRNADDEVQCRITSQGYDVKDATSVASIMIQNIEYAMNEIGINIVVYDKRKMCVADSFCVDTHNDQGLKIKRR